MIATKEYMTELCNKFDIIIFTARQVPTEAFIQWYNDHKDKTASWGNDLSMFDVESAVDYFDKDLLSLYKGDDEE